MLITKRNRQQLGYLNIAETARLCGVASNKLQYHVQYGHLPAPSYNIGKTRYYNQDEVSGIIEFFRRHVHYKHDSGDDFSLWQKGA